MLDNYMNNFEYIASSVLFIIFITMLIILTTILITSLVILAIGCLVRSQKIKSKFLIAVPGLLIGIIFILSLPIIFVHFKNFI